MQNNLKLQDTFTVINRTILHDSDRNILTILYQPIVGATAINLYFTFWTYLDQSSLLSEVTNHKQLVNYMGLSLNEVEDARKYLEAIGLIKTYVRQSDELNDYRIELFSPLVPSEFFRNPLLCSALYSALGNADYNKAKNKFIIPTIKTEGYVDISTNFQSKFNVIDNVGVDIENIRKKNYLKFKIKSSVDIDNVLLSTPDVVSNNIVIPESTKELLCKLTFLYRYNDVTTRELISKSIKGKNVIDEKLLINNFSAYYKFESNNLLPTIQKRTQPMDLREDINPKDKDARLIYVFETTDNVSYLCKRLKVKRLPDTYIDILNSLAINVGLNPGVINVLLSYILRDEQNTLNKNFATTIGADWKRRNIQTVIEAMNYVRTLAQNTKSKQTKTTIKTKSVVKVETPPEWFDKKIEIEENIDKSNEIENLLNSL